MNKRLILGVAVLLVFGTQSFAQNERGLGPLGKNFVTTVFEEEIYKTNSINQMEIKGAPGRSINNWLRVRTIETATVLPEGPMSKGYITSAVINLTSAKRPQGPMVRKRY